MLPVRPGLMRGIFTVFTLFAAASSAWAQASAPVLAPSAVLECLTPAPALRGVPSYPEVDLKLGRAGRVKVELRFAGADSAPELVVLVEPAAGDFVAAVREHVRGWRVPCAGTVAGPLRVEIEFVFKLDDRRVYSSAPRDVADERRLELLKCVTPDYRKYPREYPFIANRAEVQGRVHSAISFVAPDKPPIVKTWADPSASLLEAAVNGWVQQLRMPCHEGGPVSLTQTWVFRLDDDAYGFKPLSFVQFLRSVRGIEQRKLALDTRHMNCPFDVRLQYLKPDLRNAVSQLGSYDASRQPVLDFLADAELDVPRRARGAIFADTLDMTIPCLHLDLKP